MAPAKKNSADATVAALRAKAERLWRFVYDALQQVPSTSAQEAQSLSVLLEESTMAVHYAQEAAIAAAVAEAVDVDDSLQTLLSTLFSDADRLQAKLRVLAREVPAPAVPLEAARTPSGCCMEYSMFRTEDPELWFAELELQFALCSLASEKDKFTYLLRYLEAPQRLAIASITRDWTARTTPYAEAKDILLDEHRLTFVDRLHRVHVEEAPRADETMLRFASRLQVILADDTTDHTIIYLVCRHLSHQTRVQMREDRFLALPWKQFAAKADQFRRADFMDV